LERWREIALSNKAKKIKEVFKKVKEEHKTLRQRESQCVPGVHGYMSFIPPRPTTTKNFWGYWACNHL
jgi:hypothetical protein